MKSYYPLMSYKIIDFEDLNNSRSYFLNYYSPFLEARLLNAENRSRIIRNIDAMKPAKTEKDNKADPKLI